MPSYNHGAFIRQSIDSVLAQDYAPVELLVMDGGSTDGTVDTLRSYGDRLTFVSRRDRGQSHAINEGLRRVQGDVLCWLNSDDLLASHATRSVIDAFNSNPEADFIYGRGWNIDERGNTLGDSNVLPFDLWRLIHQRNFIHQPSCFFRRSLLQKTGFLNESFHYVMDWDLWIRFSAYKGIYVDKHLSMNRTYDSNKTQSGQFRRWREIRAMIRQYTDRTWPPVLTLYFLEALSQSVRARSGSRRLESLVARLCVRGMLKEMSGRYSDGRIARNFSFTVGNPNSRGHCKLTLSPLSRCDASRLGQAPIRIVWRSSTNGRGCLELLENGRRQEFMLPLPSSNHGPFVHFSCHSSFDGIPMKAGDGYPPRRIIGFVDGISVT
jgi:glycosyltransferase involved in cell wall biosynthesis